MNEQFWKLILLLVIPFIGGLLSLAGGRSARLLALVGSLLTLIVAFSASGYAGADSAASLSYPWLDRLGASFSLTLSGKNYLLVLLTAIVFTLIFLFRPFDTSDRPGRFYGLMMLSMTGLMGVFMAQDLLLFYFFWELALIPVYMLASFWGGEKRLRAAFKFFVYTFLGSLMMLAAIIFLYINNPEKSFTWESMQRVAELLSPAQQQYCFWVFFLAFAIKMPLFPFHTWQPDAYQQTLVPVTIVLSAVMVKMGLFAVLHWLMPLFPQGFEAGQTIAMVLSVIGIVYASLAAMRQTNIKRLIAYSSIAHIGLMALAIFAHTDIGVEAAVLQMFNHGINIAGMWFVVWMLEVKYGTQEIPEMGRLATISPALSIFFVIIAFANIGLPLTNGFVGEFLLFHGVFQSAHPNHIVFMVLAGLGIILSAVYTLNMLQKVVFFQNNEHAAIKLSTTEWLVFGLITAIILILGVYPQAAMQWIN